MEVQGFPNYLIYPDGRVWSKGSKKYIKYSDNKSGYYYVHLYKDKKPKSFRVHRLVAIHYLDNSDLLNEVDHIDRNKKNNNIDNLRWVNRSDNELNKSPRKHSTKFKWITKTKRNYYQFARKGCKNKSSKDLSKLLCYSFFYLLKNPI